MLHSVPLLFCLPEVSYYTHKEKESRTGRIITGMFSLCGFFGYFGY